MGRKPPALASVPGVCCLPQRIEDIDLARKLLCDLQAVTNLIRAAFRMLRTGEVDYGRERRVEV